MAMNKARRTANLNNILTYDTLGNSTLIANLTVEGLTGAGFVKADAAGLLSVDTAAYTVVTGATNYLTKITAPNTLGQSLVYDNGTSVLVNTAVGVPGYSHAFQVMANGAGGLVVSTTDVASAIGIVNSSSANKTWDISPYGNHLVINESGIATRMKFDAGGNITIGDITNTGHKLEVVGSFRTTGTNTLSALQGVGDRMVVANTNGVLTTQPIPTGSITGTGAAGQVNFWTGTTTVSGSNNLFWDNGNGRLGIGTNVPPSKLTVWGGDIFIQSQFVISSGTAINSYPSVTNKIKIYDTSNGEMAITMFDTNWWFRHNANMSIAGNTLIGATTNNGQRLQVYGDTLLRGSGNTSATTALTVQNSSSTDLLRVRNDGNTIVGTGTPTSFYLRGMAVSGTTGDIGLGVFNSSTTGTAGFLIGESNTSYAGFYKWGSTYTGNFSGSSIPFANASQFQSGSLNNLTLIIQGTPIVFNCGLVATNISARISTGSFRITTLANAHTDGTAILDVDASTTTAASLRIREGVAPTTPNNGDIWSTTTDLLARIGGTTYSLINSGLSGSGTAGQVTYWSSASGLTGSATLQYTPTTQLLVNNSVTTSAGNTNIKGVHVTSTLNATASGDVMTGLYLNPTFNSGAFVTSNYALYAIGDSFYDSTSLASLTVQGSNTNWAGFRIRSTATGGRSYLLAASAVSGTLGGSNFSIFDETAGQPRLTINSSGYIGLMKATASYPLDLSNNTVAVGALSSGGNLNASANLGNGLYIGVQSTTNAIVFGMFSQQQSFIWAGWNGTTIAERMRLTQNSNLLIGGTTDGGQRLQVYGDTLLNGVTTLRGTTNNDTTTIFRIEQANQNGRFLVNAAAQVQIVGDPYTLSDVLLSIGRNSFNPTSGSTTHTSLSIITTINQVGATGITRGIYVNPTITAAADWRSIEWSNNTGWGLYGVGTANNYLGGSLSIGNTTVSTFGDGGITLGSTTNGKSLVITSSIPGNNGLIQFIDNLASNAFQIAASPSNVSLFGYGSRPMIFWTNSSERMRLDASGNLGIGITPTVRLHVSGDTILRGSGATSATTALTVQSSASTDLLTVRNDGFLFNRYAAQIGNGNNVANGTNALTIVGYGSYAFNFNNSTGFTFPNVELTSSYLRLGGGGEKFIGNNSFSAGADLYLHAGWYSVTASYGKVSIGTAQASSASRTLAVFDMQTMKAQISGIIEAGSATSTNGSVILRGNYTSGYLTTLGTDGSSGGAILSYGIESAQNSTAGAFVSSSAIAIPRSAYVQNGGHIWYTAPSSSTAIGTAVVPTKHMELYNSGNLVLGGGAETAGHRLQVQGSLLVGTTNLAHGSFGSINARVADGGIAYTATNGNGTFYISISGDQPTIQSSLINFNSALRMSSGRALYLSNSGIQTPNSRIALLTTENNDVTGTRTPHVTIGETLQNNFAGTNILGFTTSWRSAFTINATTALNGQTIALGMIGTIFNQQLIAPTNNSFLAGVVISPTFSDNTFTGNTKVALGIGNSVGYSIYQNESTAINYLNGTTLIGTLTNDGINKLQVAGSIASAGIMRSDAARTAATNDVSIALLGSNITTYAAGFTMGAAGYGLNAVYAQHEQRFGGNATFDAGNLNGAGLMLNRLAPTAAGTITMNQQAGRIRTMSNLHLQTQIQGNNNITVTHMSGLHIYGHYRTTGTITLTVGDYYGVLLADPNEFSTGPTITGTNWGFYQQGAAPINAFEGSMLVGTTTTDANNRLVVSGNTRVTGNMTSAQFRLSALNTAPATSTSTGTTGEIVIDANHIYVCTATNTWKRVAIATF